MIGSARVDQIFHLPKVALFNVMFSDVDSLPARNEDANTFECPKAVPTATSPRGSSVSTAQHAAATTPSKFARKEAFQMAGGRSGNSRQKRL